MRFSKAVVKYRIPILILTVLLMIPAVIGIANTRIAPSKIQRLFTVNISALACAAETAAGAAVSCAQSRQEAVAVKAVNKYFLFI